MPHVILFLNNFSIRPFGHEYQLIRLDNKIQLENLGFRYSTGTLFLVLRILHTVCHEYSSMRFAMNKTVNVLLSEAFELIREVDELSTDFKQLVEQNDKVAFQKQTSSEQREQLIIELRQRVKQVRTLSQMINSLRAEINCTLQEARWWRDHYQQ